jgi:hypothetical protein
MGRIEIGFGVACSLALVMAGCNSGLCGVGIGSGGNCAPNDICNELNNIHVGCPNLGKPQGSCSADLAAGCLSNSDENTLSTINGCLQSAGTCSSTASATSEALYLVAFAKCVPDGGLSEPCEAALGVQVATIANDGGL